MSHINIIINYSYSIGAESMVNDCGALEMLAIAHADER